MWRQGGREFLARRAFRTCKTSKEAPPSEGGKGARYSAINSFYVRALELASSPSQQRSMSSMVKAYNILVGRYGCRF